MSDRFAMSIRFGPLEDGLAEYVMEGKGDPVAFWPSISRLRRETELLIGNGCDVTTDVDTTGFVTISICEAFYDEMEAIRVTLVAACIAYDAWVEPKYEYDGEVYKWRVGMECEWSCGADANGNAHISDADFGIWLKDADHVGFADVGKWFAGMVGAHIPPLQPVPFDSGEARVEAFGAGFWEEE